MPTNKYSTIVILALLHVVTKVNSFTPIVYSGSFQLPKFELPSWLDSAKNSAQSSPSATNNSLTIGDKILVLGGTGGVGQLVTKKLNTKGFNMRVAARDTQRADETLDDETIETVPLDLTSNFKQEDLENALDGVSAVVISLGTTAFPTQKWKDGNTPQAIDKDAVTNIAKACSNVETLKKVVLLTSVGVNRIKEMPFLFLNLFGVLDCKREGEDAVIAASKTEEGSGFDYVVIRPGRLVGGPYTNLDVAKLLQIEGGKLLTSIQKSSEEQPLSFSVFLTLFFLTKILEQVRKMVFRLLRAINSLVIVSVMHWQRL